MSKRIYVGGLPFSTTENELNALFATYGAVSNTKIITDKYSGQSRGFGFVEMANDPEAVAAMEKLNGSDFGGRKLTVNEAKPMEARTGGGGRGGFGGGGRDGGGRDSGRGGNRW
ncbi:MAG TPA: RNA-binding protein [Elusimicrobia bacterium]|nr:MAG: RNA-binding protein [Elusimicrobia bacterium GWA2_51_34]HAF94974.1 RNA-binding protein [Elusimicrobiota bacterium]HCE99116.1 RNA-binding protein [Elusimicrobiota bacterium]